MPSAPPIAASSRLSVSSWRTSRAARRAERQPHRHLLLPRRRARQQQVGDVGADDQQHQRDDDAEDRDRPQVVGVDVVDAAAARVRRAGAAPPCGCGCASVAALRRRSATSRYAVEARARRLLEHALEIALHLRRGGARLQPAHDLQPPVRRLASAAASAALGVQLRLRARAAARCPAARATGCCMPVKSGGSTPTIVTGTLLTLIVLPTTAGIGPEARVPVLAS